MVSYLAETAVLILLYMVHNVYSYKHHLFCMVLYIRKPVGEEVINMIFCFILILLLLFRLLGFVFKVAGFIIKLIFRILIIPVLILCAIFGYPYFALIAFLFVLIGFIIGQAVKKA